MAGITVGKGTVGANAASSNTNAGGSSVGLPQQINLYGTDADFTAANPVIPIGSFAIVQQSDGTVKLKAGNGIKNYREIPFFGSTGVSSYFRGKYLTLSALQVAVSAGQDGDFALVDPGVGSDAALYIWDANDASWRPSGSLSAFTTDNLPEGATRKYFSMALVMASILTGFNAATNAVVSATDTVLGAIGKLQAQITANKLFKATQAEARAGVDDTKVMSPKNVADAIIAQAPTLASSHKGVVNTTDNPGAQTVAVWWIANGPGTYVNFGGVVVSGQIGLISWTPANGFVASNINIDLTAINTAIAALNAAVGLPLIHAYSFDRSTLTTITGAGSTYSNANAVINSGKLKSVMVKTPVGSTVTPYVARSVAGVMTIVHTYTSYVTTQLDQRKVISDDFLLQPDDIVPVKSTGDFYCKGLAAGAYGFNAGVGTVIPYQFAIDFEVDEQLTGLINDVAALQKTATDVTTIKGQIGQNKYSTGNNLIDGGYVNAGGAGNTYATNQTVTLPGPMLQFEIKVPVESLGSTVNVFVYKIINLGGGAYDYEVLHSYAPFVITSEDHVQDMNDNFYIPIGATVGLLSNGKYLYKVGSLGDSWGIVNYAISPGPILVAFNYTILQSVAGGLTDRVAVIETTPNAKAKLKPVFLFQSAFNSFANLENTGANPWTVVSDGIAPGGTGIANSVYLNRRYHLNKRTFYIDFTPTADSVFNIDCVPTDYLAPNQGKAGAFYNQGSGAFAIDMTDNTFKIYGRNGSMALTLIKTINIGFALVPGRKYAFSLRKDNWDSFLTITDVISTQKFEYKYVLVTSALNAEARQQDSYKFYIQSGTLAGFKVHRMAVMSLKAKNMLMGDSITEGVLFSNVTFRYRYPVLLENDLNGDLLISARGGATIFDVIDCVYNEVQYIKPEFVIIAIGTNQGNTVADLQTLIDLVRSFGAEPVFNHVPNFTQNGVHNHLAINADIDTAVKSRAARIGCLMDVATSIDNDINNGADAADYSDGFLHPGIKGQSQKMYPRFPIDMPYLYN